MSDHPRGRLAGWILLALAGLAVAVALSVTASNLSTQPIGLSGEPLRAGDRLAPTNATRTPASVQKKAKPHVKPGSTGSAPATVPTTTTTTPSSGTDPGGSGLDSDDRGGARAHDSD